MVISFLKGYARIYGQEIASIVLLVFLAFFIMGFGIYWVLSVSEYLYGIINSLLPSGESNSEFIVARIYILVLSVIGTILLFILLIRGLFTYWQVAQYLVRQYGNLMSWVKKMAEAGKD